MKTILRALSAVSLALFFVSCGTIDTFKGAIAGNSSDIIQTGQTVKEGVEVGGKVVQANKDFSPEEEYYIGRTVAATILTMYRPWDGPKANEYLNTLGLSLALSATPPDRSNTAPRPESRRCDLRGIAQRSDPGAHAVSPAASGAGRPSTRSGP